MGHGEKINNISFIEFHKNLDKVLANFILEKVTTANRKNISDYTIMDFIGFVSDKKKEEEKNK